MRDATIFRLADAARTVYECARLDRLRAHVARRNRAILRRERGASVEFLRFFDVGESDLIAEPTRVLIRCVARHECGVVKSEGYVTRDKGETLVVIVPMAQFRAMMEGKAFPAPRSSAASWGDLDTSLAPEPGPDPDPK